MAEDTLNNDLATDLNLEGERTGTSNDLKSVISPDKVSKNTLFRNSETQTKAEVDYSLGFVFPGECHEVKQKIQDIFNQEMLVACNKSKVFSECFKNTPVGALFLNEKKLGTLISISKL